MSDEIRINDKQQGRAMAWHGKTDVQPEMTLENCWLNTWDAVPSKLIAKFAQPDGTEGEINTGLKCLFASDIPGLRIGGSYNPETYKPVLNADFLKLAKDSGLSEYPLESCGSVMDRERVFLSFQMPESYQAAGREFKAFFNLGNGHSPKSGSVLWHNTSNTCTVCNNTFTMNMEETGKTMGLRVKHTKFSELKLANAKTMIANALKAQKQFMATLEKFAGIAIDEDNAKNLFAGFVQGENSALSTRAENTVNTLVQLYKGGAGNKGENLSDAFQAITDFYSHSSAGGDNVMKQWESSEFGSGLKMKQLFYDTFAKEDTRAKNLKAMMILGKNVIRETAKAAKEEKAA